MAKLKKTKKYYFTVEGETEQWYLKWLEQQINSELSAVYRVSIDCFVQKDPLKRAKSISITQETKITHMMDYESDEPVHTERFTTALSRMKASQNLGKQIKYTLGYSNLTFELWMILHKANCNGPLPHRDQYLEPLNRAYEENFKNLKKYKHENDFKRILRKLSLENAKDAVMRAESIMQRNQENGYTQVEHKGFSYYRENPSLSIWESIKVILSDCGLL